MNEMRVLELAERVKRRFPDNPDVDDLLTKIEANELQVFPVGDDSVMIGKMLDDEVHIVAAAGKLHDLLDFEPAFCEWYKERGGNEVHVQGRRGWMRHLPQRGYVRVGDALVKDLRDE